MKILRISLSLLALAFAGWVGYGIYYGKKVEHGTKGLSCAGYNEGLEIFNRANPTNVTEELNAQAAIGASMVYARVRTGIPNVMFDETEMVKSLNEVVQICRKHPDFQIGRLFDIPAEDTLTGGNGMNDTFKDMLSHMTLIEDPAVTATAKRISTLYVQMHRPADSVSPTFTPLESQPKQ